MTVAWGRLEMAKNQNTKAASTARVLNQPGSSLRRYGDASPTTLYSPSINICRRAMRPTIQPRRAPVNPAQEACQ